MPAALIVFAFVALPLAFAFFYLLRRRKAWDRRSPVIAAWASLRGFRFVVDRAVLQHVALGTTSPEEVRFCP